MKETEPAPVFVSQDLWLTAALVCLGYRLVKVSPAERQGNHMSGRQWTHFHLEDRPDRPSHVQAYYAGTLMCPVVALRSALNLCRDAMRSAAPPAKGGQGT